MTPYSIGIIWLFFLKGMNSLGFVLLPHTLNNVPLFAEEVDFLPEKSNLAIPICFLMFVILVLVID